MAQEHSQNFLQKKGGKNILVLDENIPYLEGRRGALCALIKKIDPREFINSQYPLG